MDKKELVGAADRIFVDWEATIGELGSGRLEQPGATGPWRVRDVLAHLNGWERWQLVQLRCAFTGETPTEEELTGGVEFQATDDPSEDGMNAMFVEGNRTRPLESILADWRAISAMRSGWLSTASPAVLETEIVWDFASGSERICRLASEVRSGAGRQRVWERIFDQVEHQREHLGIVREWLSEH